MQSAVKKLARSGITQTLSAAMLVAFIVLRIWDPAAVQTLRNQSFDIYQRAWPRPITPTPVAIVDIDEKSLRALGQWPWPRTTLANLVDGIAASGAAAMAFDIIFSEGDRLSPENIVAALPDLPDDVRAAIENLPPNDATFAEAVARFRVVLGQTSVRSTSDNKSEKAEMIDIQYGFLGPDPTPYLSKFNDVLQNRPELRQAASGLGVFNVHPDSDGIFRRLPLVMMVQDKIRLSLAPELLRIAARGDAILVKADSAGISEVVVGKKPQRFGIKTDSNGTVWPWFTPHNPDRFVSVIDVINGKAAAKLRGKLVLVGTSAVGLEDFRPTPMGVPMAGVEIHAQVLENIFSKSMLWRPHFAIGTELAAIAILGLVVMILLPRVGAIWSIIITGILLGGYLAGSIYVFNAERLLIDPSFPTFSTAMLLMFNATGNYLREERERKKIRSAFGQYVSPDLVTQLAEEPERLELGGDTRELSVLFSDVRGFTALSETFKTNPAGLTELMNRFLNGMSHAILDQHGTIDKFMGDAVMAFWNAPLNTPDHAKASCRAALNMMVAVRSLNEDRLAEADGSIQPIDIGIGINTGECIVGNMGSDMRFDYTALGDTVNIASRLEGQTKTYGVPIILGDGTATQVPELAMIELDLIRVKGREAPERIFALFGETELAEEPAFAELRATAEEMLAAYRKQSWTKAIDGLEKMWPLNESLDLELDFYLDLVRARIEEFRQNSPGENWDGVYTATSK